MIFGIAAGLWLHFENYPNLNDGGQPQLTNLCRQSKSVFLEFDPTSTYMPRLSHRLMAAAAGENSLLPLLLRPCRDLPSARRELQWLTKYAKTIALGQDKPKDWRPLLHKLCQDRGRGKPLQYILGTEYFGPLEITCRPGVLIPR